MQWRALIQQATLQHLLNPSLKSTLEKGVYEDLWVLYHF